MNNSSPTTISSDPGLFFAAGKGTCSSGRAGFTLVELLVVLAIISLLTLAVSTVQPYSSQYNLRQGVYDVAALLELAHSEAIARQTYVWVGFQNVDGGANIMAVYSVNGVGSDGSPATLTKMLHVKNSLLVNWSQLKVQTRAYATQLFSGAITPESVSRTGGASSGISFTSGTTRFSGNTITFTPRGEVLLKGSVGPDDGYNPYIDISFQENRGGVSQPNANDASIIVDGANGALQIVQLQ